MEEQKTIEELQMEQINELKDRMDKMVDSAEHAKLKKEYETLLKDYVNKRPAPKTTEKKPYTPEDVKNLGKKLASMGQGNVTNREYIESALEHRQAMLDVYDKDPFGLNGQKSLESQQAADFFKWALTESKTASHFKMLVSEQLTDDPIVLQKVAVAKAEAKKQSKDKN